MKHIELKALKGCPRHAEGETFFANSPDAKALVALGKAELIDKEQSYKTRDMGNSPQNRAMTAKKPLIKPLPVKAPPVRASEAARVLATTHGIDLRTVVATGKDGSITKADVQARIPT